MNLVVGSRTTKERQARGLGMSLMRLADDGQLTLETIEKGLTNPSYLTFNAAKTRLYVVHGDTDQASTFAYDRETNKLTYLSSVTTGGRNPVHLALSPSEKQLVVSNHVSSSIAVLSIDDHGELSELSQLILLSGEVGPHRDEQPFAKPHFNPFSPCGNFVVVPDKGLDKIFSFPFEGGRIIEDGAQVCDAREGAGPRNLVFHPSGKWAYVINELDSTICAYSFNAETGQLLPFQIISSLSQHFTGNSRASGICINAKGSTLYASNRGEDSLIVVSIDEKTGEMKPIQTVPSGGKTPRFFTLSPDEHFLFVLNEDSDTIQTMSVTSEDGCLLAVGQPFASASPVCMVFA
ncbi:MAG: lactonase family protein [Pontibacterium sp.]